MYNLHDLASLTETSPRQIRRWIQVGAIPRALTPPHSRCRRLAYYTPAHVQRIREIQRIRESNVTLRDLVDRFNPEVDE